MQGAGISFHFAVLSEPGPRRSVQKAGRRQLGPWQVLSRTQNLQLPSFHPAGRRSRDHVQTRRLCRLGGGVRLAVICLHGWSLQTLVSIRGACVEEAGGLELSSSGSPCPDPCFRATLEQSLPCVTSHTEEKQSNKETK